MSYANLIDDEGVVQNFLIVMSPRVLLKSGWSLVSGTTYKQSFTKGVVRSVEESRVLLDQASSSTLSASEWFYDETAKELHVNVSADPSTKNVVPTYEMYIGTFDAHAFRDPTDDTSDPVYFEPLVLNSPTIDTNTSDSLFGFLPITSSAFTASNAVGFWEDHISHSSFNQAVIKIYHWLGAKFIPENVKLVLSSNINNVTSDERSVVFTIYSANSIFDNEFRNSAVTSTDANFYFSSTFSASGQLDPSKEFSPVRRIFGAVKNISPINVEYESDSPSTSDNREYGVATANGSYPATIGTSTNTPSAPTATVTYLTSWPGFMVGDHFETSASSYGKIIAVDITNKKVTHTSIVPLVAPATMTVGRTRAVNINRSGTIYPCFPGRDYTDVALTDDSSIVGFKFLTTMEANTGLPTTLNPISDNVYCSHQGQSASATLGGPVFGSNSSLSGSLTNVVAVIYEILRTYVGIPEAEIDASSFTTIEASTIFDVGFSLPQTNTGSFSTYKNILIQLSKSGFIKIYKNTNNKWSIALIGPLPVTASKTIGDDEILDGSFKYRINYRDILSECDIRYDFKEVNIKGELSSEWDKSQSSSDNAKYHHLVDRSKNIDTLLFDSDQADKYSQNYIFAMGDRQGTLQMSTKNRFFDTDINDSIDVSREKMPGFTRVSGTNNTVPGAINSSNKALRRINIELNDQRGIEQNKGSWND